LGIIRQENFQKNLDFFDGGDIIANHVNKRKNNWDSELNSIGEKMTTLKVSITFIIFILIGPPSVSKAAEPNNFPICKWTGEQSYPTVSGNYVVWQDKRSGGYDIYRNNPADVNDVNGVMLCAATRNQQYPSISGTTVVWQDYRPSTTNPDIYCYLLPSGPEAAVCTTAEKQEKPSIAGTIIVWQDSRNGNNDIYGNDGSEFEICTNSFIQSDSAIDGSVVVWRDMRNGDADIYGKNISTSDDIIIRIADSWQQFPAVSGNIIVWQDNRNGDSDIYGKNLATGQEIEICKYPGGEQISPAISGGIVVWEDQRGSNSDIYGYRISSQMVFPICTLPGNQKNPAIDGNFVVWEDYRNGNADIYGAYIPEPAAPSTITVLAPNGGEMLLADSEYTISWESSGLDGDTIKIEYSTDNGVNYLLLDADLPNSGSYFWQPLPMADSNQCLIRVSDTDGVIASDVSDDTFTIFQCDPSLTADLSGDCKVDFADFALFGDQWLLCGNPHDPNWCL
jgi:TolB protein